MLPPNRYKSLEAAETDIKIIYLFCVLQAWQLMAH
jgi:hypothetical protein